VLFRSNGTTAPGKPAGHIASTSSCDDCHTAASWSPASVDHVSVQGTCASCHNGSIAPGKPADHIASASTCDDCHVTSSWSQVNVDHNSVSGSCNVCHNGVTAPGKPANHITTSGQCDTCHSTLRWVPATFDHATAAGQCSGCHNGTTAPGKPANHFVTNVQCDDCHTTDRWSPTADYRHSSGNYPGDHRGDLSCRSCHGGNSQTVNWPYAAYKPDCAGCHAGDFEPSHHIKVRSPRQYYTPGELRNCAGACHVYSNNSMTTIVERQSGEHSVSSGGF